jgi:hypothetical protein
MWPVLRPVLDRFIGYEPVVAAAPFVTSGGVRPPGDVALVRVGHAYRQPVNWDATGFGEMENILVELIGVK